MEFRVEKMQEFQVIGWSKEFDITTSNTFIPQFWDEVFTKRDSKILKKYGIGEFGVCRGSYGQRRFTYMIAGTYHQESIPQSMEVLTIPASTWIKFKVVGSMPKAIHDANVDIYQNWFPQHPQFTLTEKYDIEWYGTENMDFVELWIPVQEQ